jgi:tRNA(Ile)-lysidine synthase
VTLFSTLETFLTREAGVQPGDSLVIAFSGGPDSLALLLASKRVAPRLGLDLIAAHLDHGVDPDSSRRARAASKICQAMNVPIRIERREVGPQRRSGESVEAASRRVRYSFLEEIRVRYNAEFILTAHHADDQVETVLLRLAFGSGLAGLAGIASRRDRILRPFLDHNREELLEVVRAARLAPVIDPTNLDLAVPRNRLRHLIVPQLKAADPEIGSGLRRLSLSVEQLRSRMDRSLSRRLGLHTVRGEASVSRSQLAGLPPSILSLALGLVHRSAGLPYPPSKKAQEDLARHLRTGTRIGCDCGGGWRWESEYDRVWLRRNQPRLAPFAYTLKVPGECVIPEAGLRFRLDPGKAAGWMFANSSRRTGLSLPLVAGDEVTIRSRRPGDRLRPLGCAHTRRLKDVLMDRRVPRRERDRLPLLFVGSRLAWIPGVTVNEDFKVAEKESVWVAQIDPL